MPEKPTGKAQGKSKEGSGLAAALLPIEWPARGHPINCLSVRYG